jgi:N-acetyl sugar amidotransferase
MKNKFLFLIPLTPKAYLTPNRSALRALSLQNLVNQNYDNWSAILIGKTDETIPKTSNFIILDVEGTKEAKLQAATKYIKDTNLDFDYLIRLDDDDMFNNKLLSKLAEKEFDIYIDKYHTFWDASTGSIAQQVPYWFANTCIHKKEHALTAYGTFPRDTTVFTKEKPYLIENGHGDFHKYYNQNHTILVAERNDPLYVRTLNPDSHSSLFTGDFVKYMNLFGIWRGNTLKNYSFLKDFKLPVLPNVQRKDQDFMFKLKNTYAMLKGLMNFQRKVIWKDQAALQMSKVILPYANKECVNCLLTNSDSEDITFNSKGVCNYCVSYEKKHLATKSKTDRSKDLKQLVEQIKTVGKGKQYDCIIGVSGGIDSTYVAYLSKQLGLRPLAVHLDYGWNSELAVTNINATLQKLGIDLFTYVINWEEIKDLQLAFLKASVVDIELINDFAIFAALHNEAHKRGVKYVLNGMNIETEGEKLPKGWAHEKFDQLNILSIHKRFGKVKLKSYPKLSYFKRYYLTVIYKLKWLPILNYVSYNKAEVKDLMIKELGWRDYGGKHFESIFTRFYQAYILPNKFHIDKRKFHLSVLICSGQITKEEALIEMQKPIYDPQLLKEDYDFVLKKLGLSESEFEAILDLPIKDHLDYDSYIKKHYKYHAQFFKFMKPFTKIIKTLRGIK